MKERTFVIIKPDGVSRRLMGKIIDRIERKGLDITRMELRRITKDLAREHYSEHKGKPFYDDLIKHITSGPALLMLVEGEDAVGVVSAMVGHTDPNKALPGTIRFDFADSVTCNLVHRSDSKESADREASLFF